MNKKERRFLANTLVERDLMNAQIEDIVTKALSTERPHKSTTHEERFFHFHFDTSEAPALRAITIFARKENDGVWYVTPAFCVREDEFDRKRGRTVSRRRYFNDKEFRVPLTEDLVNRDGNPTFETLYENVKFVAANWV